MPKPNACPDCFFHLGKHTAPAPGCDYCDYHDMLRDRITLLNSIIKTEQIIRDSQREVEKIKEVAEALRIKIENYKDVDLKVA